jgi:hypothetical protein
MNRTTEIMANRLELFGGISNEKGVFFGLTNGKQSFSVDMNTILMCLEVAETDGDTSTSGDRSSRTPHVTLTRTHDIDQHMIIGVMQQLSLWASWEASEPRPGRKIAGRYFDVRKAESGLNGRYPLNTSDSQKIAYSLALLIHSMADWHLGLSSADFRSPFATAFRNLAQEDFSSPHWETISRELLKLAETFDARREGQSHG